MVAAQDQWLQEAQRERLRERESDYIHSADVYNTFVVCLPRSSVQ